MSFGHWIAFALAYTAVAAAPGPVVLLVMSYALGFGRRGAASVVLGGSLGDATCLALAVLGLGALLAASGEAYAALRIAGAAYLVFLGLRLWRAPPAVDSTAPPRGSAWRVLLHVWLTATLNPKAILFFVVFVPQFMDPAAPLGPQLATMAATILVCGTAVDSCYALFAARARHWLGGGRRQHLANRVAGGVLMGEGALAALGRAVAW
ncbi:MAG: LysE family translocator [Rhodospirillales bacterium]|nr:LysE family translocator [Rhodospirillales bacterium]